MHDSRDSQVPQCTLELASTLASAIQKAFQAHTQHPKQPDDAVRFWDGITPYAIHPTWCAMTLLAEPGLTKEVRQSGALVLLWHDLLEDTRMSLPDTAPIEVIEWVQAMTFASFAEEREKIWSLTPVVRLLKLYDKTSNLLDSVWMSERKRRRYADFTAQLADDVEAHFGTLNIVRIARAIAAPILTGQVPEERA